MDRMVIKDCKEKIIIKKGSYIIKQKQLGKNCKAIYQTILAIVKWKT